MQITYIQLIDLATKMTYPDWLQIEEYTGINKWEPTEQKSRSKSKLLELPARIYITLNLSSLLNICH